MKHVFGLVLLISMVSSAFAADIRAAMGYEVLGESYSSIEAIQVGIKNQVGLSLSGQALITRKNVSCGLGIDYQLPRSHQSLPEDMDYYVTSVAFVPFYGLLSYSFPENRIFAPELIAQVGYSIPIYDYWDGEDDDDDYYDEEYKYEAKGGVYTGFGIGMRHQNLDLQLLYKVNRSELTEKTYVDGELDYSFQNDYITRQWNLSIGYKFRI